MSESLQELFERAGAMSREARERFVSELAAAGDPLAPRLRRMLEGSESGDISPLDGDPWAHIAGEEEPADERPVQIGPYRILSELGRGGMGRVYLAEQGGADFRRNVALKVVAPEGAGVADIERRFGEERRILAGLEHPGIARLYDAGRAEDGRWYLALEYVAGSNLLDHVRRHDLPLTERLRLFLAVLEAVAYAHAASVVHRDLKPANILVGLDGRPRLLDFGIAKFVDAAEASAAASAVLTRTGTRALTPAYASPEQFRGEPITPASDVFSLGVVFYELLTGVRPFVQDGTQIEVERAVLSEDPEPPSTACRRSPGVTMGAARAESGRRTLSRSPRLSRDLDAICLKALDKDPRARYASAAEFAADLERHLAGLPVGARGGGFAYRLSRHYRRHRRLIAGAAFVAAGVAIAGIAAVVATGTASHEGGRTALAPVPAPEPAPRKFPYSGVQVGDIRELERRFAAEPGSVETGSELALALNKGGHQPEAELIVARLRQIPARARDPLIDYVEATLAMSASQPQRALVLLASALEGALADGRGELVSQTRASRGRLLSTLGRSDEARTEMEAARAGFESSGDSASLARVLNDLAVEELQRGHLAAGERLLEQALAASRAAGPGGGGVILGNLAGIAVQRGRPDLAEPRYRESVEIFREAKSRRLSWALTDLSEALRDLGRVDEADTALKEAIELQRAGSSAADLALALSFRGAAQLEAGAIESVNATIVELAELARSSGDRPSLAFAARLRGQVAAARGDLEAARRELGEAQRLLLEHGQSDGAAAAELVLAEVELDFGDLDAARALAERTLAASGASDAAGAESTTAFVASALLAEIEARSGHLEASRRLLDSLGSDGARSPSVSRRLSYLSARAQLARAGGDESQARGDLESALACAESAGRKMRALEIRRRLAALPSAHPQGATLDQIEEFSPSKPSANIAP